MKIFLVIANLAAGGAERVMSELANIWIKDSNLDIHIVLLTDNEIFYELDDNITIHNFYLDKKNILYKLKSLLVIFRNFSKLIQKEKPDVILSFMNKYNIFTLISLFRLKVKVIVSERDSPTEKLPKVTVFLRNVMYQFANGIICQTQSSREFIINETKNDKVVVIPNPIKMIKVDNVFKKEKIILNMGRLVHKKGQDYLLEAFSNIEDDTWKLVILGEGDLRIKLKKRIKELSLEDRVFLEGTVKNVDVWLNKASIFAFPSIMEGFPNALAEAMSAGLPCVSFDCETGPRDLIKDSVNGFLVDVGDTKQLTFQLNKLIKNKNLREEIGKEALKVQEKLNSKKIAKQYMTFLKLVIEDKV